MPTIFSPPLSVQRYCYIQRFLEEHPQISSLTDVGCGNGRMLNWSKVAPELERINCIDIDAFLLEDQMDQYFRPNLYDMLFGRKNSKKALEINVFQGDIVVPDDRLKADCFTLVEMIEHITLAHLEKVCRTVFAYYRPNTVIVTTPNTEFNTLLRQLGSGDEPNRPEDPNSTFRHRDHKFEWTRMEFMQWAQVICANYGYTYQLDGVGELPGSEPYGPCTQIAIFTREQTDPTDPMGSLAGDLSCFDLLLNKLSVEEEEQEEQQQQEQQEQEEEQKPQCLGDRQLKRICLMGAFKIPAGLKEGEEPAPPVSFGHWDDVVQEANSNNNGDTTNNDSYCDDDDTLDYEDNNQDCNDSNDRVGSISDDDLKAWAETGWGGAAWVSNARME